MSGKFMCYPSAHGMLGVIVEEEGERVFIVSQTLSLIKLEQVRPKEKGVSKGFTTVYDPNDGWWDQAQKLLDRFDEKNSIYIQKGYKDRADYLRSLAEDYDADLGAVKQLADLLGPSEDFDGLVSSVEDAFG